MTTTIHSSDALLEATVIAKRVHLKHTYGDGSYYENHLKPVAISVFEHAGERSFEEKMFLMAAALLHDAVEDTDEDVEALKLDISRRCGGRVLEIVLGVTDEPGETRKERKAKTYLKIQKDDDALLVKLCDRLANVSSGKKNDMYVKEHTEFRDALYNGKYNELWSLIEVKLGLN